MKSENSITSLAIKIYSGFTGKRLCKTSSSCAAGSGSENGQELAELKIDQQLDCD